MAAIIDLKAEFGHLLMLRGRSPTTTDAEKAGSIAQLAPYRDGAIFAAKFAGATDWERHPRGDEIVQIVDGATTLYLLAPEGCQTLVLTAGMAPRNLAQVRGGRRRVANDGDAAADGPHRDRR
jgi:hypothetical protein